ISFPHLLLKVMICIVGIPALLASAVNNVQLSQHPVLSIDCRISVALLLNFLLSLPSCNLDVCLFIQTNIFLTVNPSVLSFNIFAFLLIISVISVLVPLSKYLLVFFNSGATNKLFLCIFSSFFTYFLHLIFDLYQ